MLLKTLNLIIGESWEEKLIRFFVKIKIVYNVADNAADNSF